MPIRTHLSLPNLFIGLAFLITNLVAGPVLFAQEFFAQVPQIKTSIGNNELEIKKTIDSYIDAFNQADAVKLANHWTELGSFSTSSGRSLVGHEQLEEAFLDYFKNNEGAVIELPESKITFLSPNVAIEKGITLIVSSDSDPRETQYTAIHVKTAKGWKIDKMEEKELLPARPSRYEQLQPLEWMIGSWIDTDEEALIETNCRWTTNQNFIVKTFKVFIEEQIDFEGTQVIGWDPQVKAIRSWTFDSDGGFGVGHWTGAGDSWTVRTLNVLPDGRQGSSTNTYNVLDEDTVQYRSLGRQVDGKLLPSIDPVTLSRISVNE